MNSIELSNFKAFKNNVSLTIDGKNALIYGENGAGKSSLFEALKLFFFREKIFDEQIPSNYIGQDRIAEEERILNDYKQDIANNIIIKVDSEDFESHNNADDDVFLVSYGQLTGGDELIIKDIIHNSYFSHTGNVQEWNIPAFYDLIVNDVNEDLENNFYLHNVELHLSDSSIGKCSLKSNFVTSEKQNNLARYFNESILHIVRFIIIIECICYFSPKDKSPLIIFDDCINSLDTPNRTFLIKFLLKKVGKAQKILLTHNTGFYNLLGYIYSNVFNQSEDWKKFRLFRIDDNHSFLNGEEKTTKDIKGNRNNGDPISLGNDIRRRFEVLVYELSRLNNVGELQEVGNLLDRLCQKDCPVYLSLDGERCKNVYNLVDEIYSNVTNGNDYNLAKRLKEKIDSYRNHSFIGKIQDWLIDTRLMQKVALHQASHGHAGIPPVENIEIDYSIALLEKLEAAINTVKREDVSSV